jgi:hypothetical protein
MFLEKFKGEKMTDIITNYNSVVSKAVSFKIDVVYDINILYTESFVFPSKDFTFSSTC